MSVSDVSGSNWSGFSWMILVFDQGENMNLKPGHGEKSPMKFPLKALKFTNSKLPAKFSRLNSIFSKTKSAWSYNCINHV